MKSTMIISADICDCSESSSENYCHLKTNYIVHTNENRNSQSAIISSSDDLAMSNTYSLLHSTKVLHSAGEIKLPASSSRSEHTSESIKHGSTSSELSKNSMLSACRSNNESIKEFDLSSSASPVSCNYSMLSASNCDSEPSHFGELLTPSSQRKPSSGLALPSSTLSESREQSRRILNFDTSVEHKLAGDIIQLLSNDSRQITINNADSITSLSGDYSQIVTTDDYDQVAVTSADSSVGHCLTGI